MAVSVMPTPVGSTTSPVVWWYGRGRAVDVTRCLEGLYSLPSPPGPVGAVTVYAGELAVAFTAPLRTALPPPWQPAGAEQRIAWEAIPAAATPDPSRPVCLVAFGTTGTTEDLLVLNLAAFGRLRIDGDRDVTRALAGRWMLEIVTTHPATTIGITSDLWAGPYTSRIRPVTVGAVPDVDVLMIGGDLTYADRAQIAAAATSPILLDFGEDAATTTAWTITCDAERRAQIGNGRNAMSAIALVPSSDVLELCAGLLSSAPLGPTAPRPDTDRAPEWDDYGTGPDDEDDDPAAESFVDFFGTAEEETPHPDIEPPPPGDSPTQPGPSWEAYDDEAQGLSYAVADPTSAPTMPPPPAPTTSTPQLELDKPTPVWTAPAPAPDPASDNAEQADLSEATVTIAPTWNRILGAVQLHPPAGGTPGAREKRLNELTTFLQRHRWVTPGEIIDGPLGGAASEKTVTQQMSLLRSRLGDCSDGRRALPPMEDGQYHLDARVRSDWMEFDDLVQMLAERTDTARLVAAMSLVTGPMLGGIGAHEWKWASDLREEIRDRVADAAAVLAQRHYDAKHFSDAVAVAQKGLWYDEARQDIWHVALSAALDGKDADTSADLRKRYLAAIPGPDRQPAVFDLTRRLG